MELNPEKMPVWFRWFLVAIACWALYWQGMGFLNSLKPKLPYEIMDFFQDYASARNYLEGLPVYTNQAIAIERYLGIKMDDNKQRYIIVNAHPPTSILLFIPITFLDYADAQLVWNLISLGLFIFTLWRIFRELSIRISLWMLPPFIIFLLTCSPLRQQLNEGQLNFLLLFILVEVWIANRSERNYLAGGLIGIAASIKLFPGFMFLYFVLRRKWQSILSGIICFILLTWLTAGIFGPNVYSAYLKNVLPVVSMFRSNLINSSIIGFWSKLFDTVPAEHIVPLTQSPILARMASGLSCLTIIICLFLVGEGSKTKDDSDILYSLFVIALLLLSPLTWEHAFLLLILPFIVIWKRVKEKKPVNMLFLFISGLLFLEKSLIWRLFYPEFRPETWQNVISNPVLKLTIFAYPFYALVGFFVIGLMACKLDKS